MLRISGGHASECYNKGSQVLGSGSRDWVGSSVSGAGVGASSSQFTRNEGMGLFGTMGFSSLNSYNPYI